MMQLAIATLGDDYHTSALTHAHKENYFNIVYALHPPSNMWQRFLWTLVQAPVIQIPLSYHIWKGNEVPMWLCRIQLKASGREKCCWKGRRKNSAKCRGPRHCWTFFTVSDWHVFAPRIIAGVVKQVTLYSGFIQHQSSSPVLSEVLIVTGFAKTVPKGTFT